MKTIRVSMEVWDQIAKRGKFGETEDDVLRRVFGMDSHDNGSVGIETNDRRRKSGPQQGRYATRRQHADVRNGQLIVSYEEGPERRWDLPDRSDKPGIRRVMNEALDFGEANGATIGQLNAIRKALTSAGYHLTK